MKIKAKVTFLFLFLLAISIVIGVITLSLLDHHFRAEQSLALEETACKLSNAVKEKPSLFLPSFSTEHPPPYIHHLHLFDVISHVLDTYDTAYALSLKQPPITFDGGSEDWDAQNVEYQHYSRYSTPHSVLLESQPQAEDPPEVDHIRLKDSAYLYTLFKVKDKHVLTEPIPYIADVALGDHLQVVVKTPKGLLYYAIPLPKEGGLIYPYTLNPFSKDERFPNKQEDTSEPLFTGTWKKTTDGYVMELRVELSQATRIAFAVADVDNRNEGVATLLAISQRIPEPVNLKKIIDSELKNDEQKYALYLINPENELTEQHVPFFHSKTNIWPHIKLSLLHFYEPKPLPYLTPGLYENPNKRPEISSAFKSQNVASTTQSYFDTESNTRAASACQVKIGDTSIGVLVIEQYWPNIMLFDKFWIVIAISVVTIFFLIGFVWIWLFAYRLSDRVVRLRNQAEKASGFGGDIHPEYIQFQGNDELGELTHSFRAILSGMKTHHEHLQNLAGRLAHELRTPLAVVSSSLENLEEEENEQEQKIYVERAKQGVHRLIMLISSLTEASRLEQTVRTDEKERFDLTDLVASCSEGYKMIYPEQKFDIKLPDVPIILNGAPEMIAQMLDKFMANAVDFVSPGTAVEIHLTRFKDCARLDFANQGTPLPAEIRQQLFTSMVSQRDVVDKAKHPHLGMGLYIVRLIVSFHGGTVSALEYPGAPGVVFRVELPFNPTRLTGVTVKQAGEQ